MHIADALTLLVQYWHIALISTLALVFLQNKYNRGLNQYPGPWIAAYTDWWRFFTVLGGKSEKEHIRLHDKHGDVVRLGPNFLSFSDPAAIRDIYGLNMGYAKV